jgi:adenine-specific DNA-methyltransferase
MHKQRLELDWIGKDNEPKLEPRILIERSELSCGQAESENKLIKGDNLLALRALQSDFNGKISCIYIDPPYNTGAAFNHYDDGVEHSLWLSLMRDRLVILHKLLEERGTLWISIDDNEAHYLKVLADEIFGRANFVASVVWRSSDNSNNDAKQFSRDHNYILVYSKSPDWIANRLARKDEQKAHYTNPDNDPRGPWFDGNPISSPKPRPNLTYDLLTPSGKTIKPPKNGWRWAAGTMKEKIETGEIRFTADETGIRRRTYLADQEDLPPSSLWVDLEETGHNRQAKYEQKKLFPNLLTSELFDTPKPERVIQKILKIATKPGDWVLDSFAGSGTTGAVAHKMNRNWVMVEMGNHCENFIRPRMEKVIKGEDQGGISEEENWTGGGGFKYYDLAPSLLQKDNRGNWVISPKYNGTMLAEAVCKHEGFKFWPDQNLYWKQGHSTEKDFIFVTTEFLTAERLEKIAALLKPEESLLICAKAYKVPANKYSNITIKKIPQILLGRCEFGRDDYSLNIKEPIQEELELDEI